MERTYQQRRRDAHIGNLGEWTTVVDELEQFIEDCAYQIAAARHLKPAEAEFLIRNHAWRRFGPEETEA